MRKVTIIGAGVSGLRAAWELVNSNRFQVVMVEKSPSVGGRVASRRFTNTVVNHGAQRFDGLDKVWAIDPWARELMASAEFSSAATDLPKKMRDRLLSFPERFELKTQWHVKQISEGEVLNLTGEVLHSSKIIVTAPIPQVEALWGQFIPGVQYSKSILFIGEQNGAAVRLEMAEDWSEKYFEETDAGILSVGEKEMGRKLTDLSVKKWRYARVLKGRAESFLSLQKNIFAAGDAFDSAQEFNLGSAWISGLMVARHIIGSEDA